MRFVAFFSALILMLTGCSQTNDMFTEADFGGATRNNSLVMQGDLSYTVALNDRFTREAPATVNFAFDSDVLDPTARLVLDKQADWIRQFPEVRFNVYGYTDKVGASGYNQNLGKRRAQAVVSYLETRGINRSRLQALVSFGENRPLIDTPNRERLNRRSVTEVAGFVSRHPTVLDGKYAEVVFREYVASAEPVDGLTRRNNTGGFGSTQ